MLTDKQIYRNIGLFIGMIRKNRQVKEGNEKLKQNNFILDGKRQICSQSKLSKIENGHTVEVYPEEIECLIRKLDRKPENYSVTVLQYESFCYQFINILQFGFRKQLIDLFDEYKATLKINDSVFYLSEMNSIIDHCFDYYLNENLPQNEWIDEMFGYLPAFCEPLAILTLDLFTYQIEFFYSEFNQTKRLFDLTLKLKSNDHFTNSIKALTLYRIDKKHESQKIISGIPIDQLNKLMQFRLYRLDIMMNQMDHDFTKAEYGLPEFDFKTSMISKYETSRIEFIWARKYYINSLYLDSISHFEKAIDLNPEMSVFSFFYLMDCFYELGDYNPIQKYLVVSEKHLNRFDPINALFVQFIDHLINNYNSDSFHIFLFNKLLPKLKALHSDHPYIGLFRKYLLVIAKENRQYKLIYDFDNGIQK